MKLLTSPLVIILVATLLGVGLSCYLVLKQVPEYAKMVAAMRPKSNGSSTTGMKKSVVAIKACWSLSKYTAASSEVSMPTSNCGGSAKPFMFERMSRSTPGAILQPQPPPWASEVNRGCVSSEGAFMRQIYHAAMSSMMGCCCTPSIPFAVHREPGFGSFIC